MGRLLSLYVPKNEDQIAAVDVIALVRGLRLSRKFHDVYCMQLDALEEHYGSRLSSGAFANLFDPMLLDSS